LIHHFRLAQYLRFLKHLVALLCGHVNGSLITIEAQFSSETRLLVRSLAGIGSQAT